MKLSIVTACILVGMISGALAQTAPPKPADPTGVNVDYALQDENGHTLPPICSVPEVKAVPAVPATATTPAAPAIEAKPGQDCAPFNAAFVFKKALLWPSYPGEDKLTPEQMSDTKWARWALLRRIEVGGMVAMKKPEKDALGKLVPQIFPPLVVGQIMPLLFPETTAPELH